MSLRTLTLAGHAVACFELGERSAPDVVLVHGIGVSSRYFAPLERELSRDAHVVAPDLPGFGRSRVPDEPALSVGEHADVLAALVEELALDRPVVVGHSMGGKVAMMLALRHPELVDRLVVSDIAPASGGSLGEFEHLLDSLAAIDLSTVRRRADAAAVVRGAELVLLAVPDDTLPDLVAGLSATGAWQAGQIVVHTSGRHGAAVLAPAREQHVLPLALHPAMTFTGTAADLDRLSPELGGGCVFGLTAGAADHWPLSPFEPTASLPGAVYRSALSPSGDRQQQAWGAALLLLAAAMLLNVGVRLADGRRRWSGPVP